MAMLQSIDPYRPNTVVAGKVTVFGSTSMDAMAHGWATGFKQFHPKCNVDVSAAGSDAAFDQLIASPTGVGMFSRPITPDELESLKAKGLKNPAAFPVAREALSVFVHASNPMTAISGEQLRAVFTADGAADVLNWSALGVAEPWGSKPVQIISRTETSGTQSFLRDFVFNGASLRPSVSSHVSNAEVLQALEKEPFGIAICGYRSSGNSVKQLQLTAGASIVPSDDHAVLCGQYPLTRPMSLVIDLGQSGADAEASQEFVRYAMCQAGQTQAIMVGLFPVDLPLLRAGLQRFDSSKLH
jgi:phosphate transport system substrate-binding protein